MGINGVINDCKLKGTSGVMGIHSTDYTFGSVDSGIGIVQVLPKRQACKYFSSIFSSMQAYLMPILIV